MTRFFLAALLSAGSALAPAFAEVPAAAAESADPIYAALAQARAQHKPVLVNYHAPWCYSCYFMAKNVLVGPDWDKALKDTIMVELDADSPEGQKWMAAWTVKAMPSYLLFDAEGHELGRILGEQSRPDFYGWLNGTLSRAVSVDSLKGAVVDTKEPSLAAAREVLRTYHARYDGNGGLAWFLSLPPAVRGALSRDAVASSWVSRLELMRASAEKDASGCANVAPMVLNANLGCERPYELGKVMGCTEGLPEATKRDLIRPQVEPMQTLVEKRVLSEFRCADERSIVLTTADLYAALGDAPKEKLVLDRAIADVKARVNGDLKKDRNLSDNWRVYLDRAGRIDELDALLDKLIEAYPEDYVYNYRKGKSLAARNLHEKALPYFEKAAEKAFGMNQLTNAEYRAKTLQALNRNNEARAVLAEVIKTTGPFFPEVSARLTAYMHTLELPPAPKAS